MNHSLKRRRQALIQTHHHYYLNISVEAANLSDWRIKSNRIETFFSPNWNALLRLSDVRAALLSRRVLARPPLRAIAIS